MKVACGSLTSSPEASAKATCLKHIVKCSMLHEARPKPQSCAGSVQQNVVKAGRLETLQAAPKDFELIGWHAAARQEEPLMLGNLTSGCDWTLSCPQVCCDSTVLER